MHVIVERSTDNTGGEWPCWCIALPQAGASAEDHGRECPRALAAVITGGSPKTGATSQHVIAQAAWRTSTPSIRIVGTIVIYVQT